MKQTIKYLIIAVVGILTMFIVISTYWRSQPYYKKYHYVAHALGNIDGLEYTNSREALNYSYSMGIRLMEVDFLYTSDGHLVCRHKWDDQLEAGFSNENVPDYETFMSTKIHKKYTPLDIESLIRFAMENSDVYFITDIKARGGDLDKLLEEITETAKKLGYTDLDRQFIVQFYNYEDYETVSEKYSFQNYIFTLYYMKDEVEQNGITNILDFCLENDIKVITLPKKYVTKEMCKILKENDITFYIHTVNSRRYWLKYKLMGVDGIYTDYIYPLEMNRLYMILVLVGVILILLILRYFVKVKKKLLKQDNL